MMGAAQLECLAQPELDEPDEVFLLAVADDPAASLPHITRSALRQAAADKLAAHRQRRARTAAALANPDAAGEPVRTPGKNGRIVAAVAERYAQTPSYRAFLAAEAERAAHQATAAAEIAARNAEAVRAVQQELLAELELWTAPQEFSEDTAAVSVSHPTPEPSAYAAPTRQLSSGGLTVRLYEDSALAGSSALLRQSASQAARTLPSAEHRLSEEEAQTLHELEEEIAFRQAPVFEHFTVEPHIALPANLLEFPRQLVAAKKVRPRLAEGPLSDDAPRSPQLRIFEVEPEQISTIPDLPAAAPAWSTLRLDSQPVITPEPESYQGYEAVILAEQLAPSTPESLAAAPRTTLATIPAPIAPQPAPFTLRLMAGMVDLALVLFALLGVIVGCVRVTGWLPGGLDAGLAAGATVLLLYICYYLLFFTLSDQTPGMRYARLGLCTLHDENPSRGAMRQRLLAQLVAIIPLGIGVLWSLIDEQRLGWHDRLSGMYLRAY